MYSETLSVATTSGPQKSREVRWSVYRGLNQHYTDYGMQPRRVSLDYVL